MKTNKKDTSKRTAVEFIRSYEETQKIMESIANQTTSEHNTLMESIIPNEDYTSDDGVFNMDSLLDVNISDDNDMQPKFYNSPMEELSDSDKNLIIDEFTNMIKDGYEEVIDFSDIGPVATVIQDRYGFKQNIEQFLRDTVQNASDWQQTQKIAVDDGVDTAGEKIVNNQSAPIDETDGPTDIEPNQSGPNVTEPEGISMEEPTSGESELTLGDVEGELGELDTDVAPELDTDVAPELDTDVAPELDTDVAPELDTDVAPELDTDVAPELDTDVAPELNSVDEDGNSAVENVVEDVVEDAVEDVFEDSIPEVDSKEISKEAGEEVDDISIEDEDEDEDEDSLVEYEIESMVESTEEQSLEVQLEAIKNRIESPSKIDTLIEAAAISIESEKTLDAQLEAIRTSINESNIINEEGDIESEINNDIYDEDNIAVSDASADKKAKTVAIEDIKSQMGDDMAELAQLNENGEYNRANVSSILESISSKYHKKEDDKIKAVQKEKHIKATLESIAQNYKAEQTAKLEAADKEAKIENKLDSLVESYHKSQKGNLETRKATRERIKQLSE